MRISVTFDIDDRLRRAINAHRGRPGLASKRDCRLWCWMNGVSTNDDILQELDDEELRERAEVLP